MSEKWRYCSEFANTGNCTTAKCTKSHRPCWFNLWRSCDKKACKHPHLSPEAEAVYKSFHTYKEHNPYGLTPHPKQKQTKKSHATTSVADALDTHEVELRLKELIECNEPFESISKAQRKEKASSKPLAECPICLEPIPRPEQSELECLHVFHKHCISAVLDATQGPAACPVCRQEIDLSWHTA